MKMQGDTQRAYAECERVFRLYGQMGTVLKNKVSPISRSETIYSMVNGKQCALQRKDDGTFWFLESSNFRISLIENNQLVSLDDSSVFMPWIRTPCETRYQHPTCSSKSFDIYNWPPYHNDSSALGAIPKNIEDKLRTFESDTTCKDVFDYAYFAAAQGKIRLVYSGHRLRGRVDGKKYQVISVASLRTPEVTLKGPNLKLKSYGDSYLIEGLDGHSPKKILEILSALGGKPTRDRVLTALSQMFEELNN